MNTFWSSRFQMSSLGYTISRYLPVTPMNRSRNAGGKSATLKGARLSWLLQGLEGVADVVEEALLELRQLERVRGDLVGVAPQHFLAQRLNGIPQGIELRDQVGSVFCTSSSAAPR